MSDYFYSFETLIWSVQRRLPFGWGAQAAVLQAIADEENQ